MAPLLSLLSTAIGPVDGGGVGGGGGGSQLLLLYIATDDDDDDDDDGCSVGGSNSCILSVILPTCNLIESERERPFVFR